MHQTTTRWSSYRCDPQALPSTSFADSIIDLHGEIWCPEFGGKLHIGTRIPYTQVEGSSHAKTQLDSFCRFDRTPTCGQVSTLLALAYHSIASRGKSVWKPLAGPSPMSSEQSGSLARWRVVTVGLDPLCTRKHYRHASHEWRSDQLLCGIQPT